MAQVNHRDKSYRSCRSRLRLVDPSVSLVIRSQRPDKNTNTYKEETASLEVGLTLLLRKAHVQSDLHWEGDGGILACQLILFIKRNLKNFFFFAKITSGVHFDFAAENAAIAETTGQIGIFAILSWSKMCRRRSRLVFSMNFAWLRIHEERISQIIFATIVFQAGGGWKHNSRRETRSPLGQTEVNADEQRGFVWDLGVGLLGRRFDKQCQRPDENLVIHGSSKRGSHCRSHPLIPFFCGKLWLASERRVRLTWLSQFALL